MGSTRSNRFLRGPDIMGVVVGTTLAKQEPFRQLAKVWYWPARKGLGAIASLLSTISKQVVCDATLVGALA